MKTDHWIDMLAHDGAAHPPLGRTLGQAGGIGLLIAAPVFLLIFGIRPDFAAAAADIRLWVKIATPALLLAGAGLAVMALSRPTGRANRLVLFAAPVLIGLAVIAELVALPASAWGAALFGDYALECVVSIPLLALAPFIALMRAAREGAPTRPGLAGAAIGLAAAGCGATLYAFYCPDDSPLFVAAWYGLAALAMAGLGALVGQRWLRW